MTVSRSIWIPLIFGASDQGIGWREMLVLALQLPGTVAITAAPQILTTGSGQ
ncbi:hypothetical protein BDI4_1080002 [Burkholderia diffusa]|nr:hypothetical protein BDI4_1080002 [Burkholderia diffusa]